jgi:hypothetical protein
MTTVGYGDIYATTVAEKVDWLPQNDWLSQSDCQGFLCCLMGRDVCCCHQSWSDFGLIHGLEKQHISLAVQVWAMATMVIGGFFLSFCFGRIASIVSSLDADRAARADQLQEVTQFLRDHELPKPLSRK